MSASRNEGHVVQFGITSSFQTVDLYCGAVLLPCGRARSCGGDRRVLRTKASLYGSLQKPLTYLRKGAHGLDIQAWPGMFYLASLCETSYADRVIISHTPKVHLIGTLEYV
jgi:hypothetical protein